MVEIKTRELAGQRPVLNEGAVVCHDTENNVIYYYGGHPWADDKVDDNTFNESRKPTTNLFKLDVRTQRWTHLTPEGQTYLEPSSRLPFVELLDEEESDFWQSETHAFSLPPLSDAMSAFYRDRTTCKSYILVFGGRKDKDATTGVTLEPVSANRFICIDVTCQIDPLARRQACVYWRDVEMEGWYGQGLQHRYGGTAEIVENEGSILFCVFGGYFFPKARWGEGVGSPCETYAIADLTQQAWIVPNYPLPTQIDPLGYRPHIVRLQGIPGNKNILLLSGWASSETGSATRRSPSSCIFDPFETAENAFALRTDLMFPSLPPMTKSYFSTFLKPKGGSSKSDTSTLTAMLVGWRLKKLDAIRQKKTFDLSLFNVKAEIQKVADGKLIDDYQLEAHSVEDGEPGSPTSSDATAVNPDSDALVDFHWSQNHLDDDSLITFDNIGTDFIGDFAVITNGGLDMESFSSDGISIHVFGYKKAHAWSPAITINTVVQLNIKNDELIDADVLLSDNDDSSSDSECVSDSDSDSESKERSIWCQRSRTSSPGYPSSPVRSSPTTIPDSDDAPFNYLGLDQSHTHDPLQLDLVESLTNGMDGLDGLGC
ncbi:hypothetical protein SCHPADRAFT_939189 [Schizopora paradoxa]|uniref:Galactose oxidase n=1 Tax=Schizopora paradoxa TaxID=27342 RepID=A0A0H2SDB2_9AGAM|nr:hypothetical protein SCHPADRAFT_939189 [Schizopora paradoxa]